MEIKTIYVIDVVLVATTCMCMLVFVGYTTPNVIANLDTEVQEKGQEVLFSIDKSEHILLATDPGFTSATQYILTDKTTIDLAPGLYYLKVREEGFSRIITLTSKTDVTLAFQETKTRYNIINAGKKTLDVEIHDMISKELFEIREAGRGEDIWN